MADELCWSRTTAWRLVRWLTTGQLERYTPEGWRVDRSQFERMGTGELEEISRSEAAAVAAALDERWRDPDNRPTA